MCHESLEAAQKEYHRSNTFVGNPDEAKNSLLFLISFLFFSFLVFLSFKEAGTSVMVSISRQKERVAQQSEARTTSLKIIAAGTPWRARVLHKDVRL